MSSSPDLDEQASRGKGLSSLAQREPATARQPDEVPSAAPKRRLGPWQRGGESRRPQGPTADAAKAADAAEAAGTGVEVRGLTKRYGGRKAAVDALRGVDLAIPVGELAVLLGPSGCGKTTLLRCIAGLEVGQSGTIALNRRLVYRAAPRLSLPPEQRDVGMVFQSYALWPHMTVRDNVAYPLRCRHVSRREVQQKVAEALDAVGLSTFAARYPAQLSGGQQQRVSLARAVVAGSGVILFDEPLSNVDAKVRVEIRRQITELQARIGFTGIYVTHDHGEASELADRIILMDQGSVIQAGAPEELYEAPATPFVARFMGELNEYPGEISREDPRAVSVSTQLGAVRGRPVGDSPGPAGTAAFRHESVELHDTEVSGPNCWPVVIERVTFSAGVARVLVRVGQSGAAMTALAPRHAWSAGDRAWARVPHDRVWVFSE